MKPRDIRIIRMLHYSDLTRAERRIYKRWLNKNKIWCGAEVIDRMEKQNKKW